MKTGCKVESPQFTKEERLKPTIALLSIVTLTLLAMRDASRRPDAKTRKATEIVSEDYVAVLSAWRPGNPPDMPKRWVDGASGCGIVSGIGAGRPWTVRKKRTRVESMS